MPSLFAVTIPVFITQIRILKTLLAKGVAHAPSAEGQAGLISARLIADMEGLAYQIQRVSDTAKGVAVRLGGAEPVPMADDEKTFPELQTRLDRTIAVLESVKEESMTGKDASEVVIKTGKGELKFTGESYVLTFAIPNFYFHVMAAYAIMRAQGVPIGKTDYLGLQ